VKKTYKIPDMHCPNCSIILESIEDRLPGIKGINASYKKGEMMVEFDEAKVSEGQILAAIEKKGYHIGS
jgi:copper chaperone CopZ